ncbi:DNA-directed RNA polymerase subunit alpha [Candidatus Kaiserbacteria bacterium RIFCSPLOWO2_02_FULL_54_13]|uniref:DNA-directed RNA polymerase subunit alpha n=1 Tax=Candidatus Kaiserbacteria bacterium RIFCSPHIGHO2_02_FULL_54_22 TaxID=1798495 RepID=A0A1F6DND1_9BACT|nr:MAG: DNA-directed RNA polymerase subunit alpha [Candidatus Kaiserbacteria bacterium RIFCSPHIGHO2_02_FULL_54_22]OGG68101.1 MAG: DNA-directed RNA polymerase subunit alpha [Candidatus Kaiserbacteria bacterium RIFCSPHIGHO2_12_FULL_54_16]OGG83598.1 MAG: DNA-directed RNA polymerase subunit alpha [Candidatus Kaiserbacteria bacterium RIFCSPLOWO2_02_FULL_54_13]OGG90097.1 MAG: DNA-directed RNA polymerase subunit alpha [Candidatus Kaiserbacteria bacterium RIFCSPLOWO2_12_FULL_54_10]
MTLPSKPRIVSEEGLQGVYEIDSLYPGYGHTLGNSLRRIILSSLPGASVTQVKIEGVPHEFATVDGVRETVMEVLLNLKRVHFILHGDEPQTISLMAKGAGEVTAKDFKLPSQVEIKNTEQHIADLSGKAVLELEATIERGLGYVPREVLTKDKVDIGTIALDATFTPIRRVNYDVENMRVGDRTDFNRLRILIETNGTIAPREALEKSIETMIHQLKAVIGFQENEASSSTKATEGEALVTSASKIKVADLELSPRVASALEDAGIKSAAGLARKTASALKELDGIGDKAIEEISVALAGHGLTLRPE